MKTFLRRYGALLLCLVLAVLLGWHVHDTQQKFQQAEDYSAAVSRENDRLEEELSLAETKGLLQEHWVYYGPIDGENRTMELSLSVLPRQYDPDTRVSVTCNGEECPMEWSQGAYRFSMDASLDASCKVTSVTVTQGDQVEQAEVNWELMDHRSFTPRFTSGGYFLEKSRDGDLVGKGMFHMSNLSWADFGLNSLSRSAHSGTLLWLMNGETVQEMPVTWRKLDNDMYRAEPQITITQEQESDTEYVLVMTNSQGITYRFTALRYHCTEPDGGGDFYQNHEYDLSTQVYAPNGDLLYTVLGDGSMPDTKEH